MEGSTTLRFVSSILSDNFAGGHDGEGDGGGFIGMHGSHVTFENSSVTRNQAAFGAGLIVMHQCDVQMVGCSVTHNLARAAGGGLMASESIIQLIDVQFVANEASAGGGVYMEESQMNATRLEMARS